MSNRKRAALLALLLALFASAVPAQQPQDETPSLTTEDVTGPEPIVAPEPDQGVTLGGPVARLSGSPSLDEIWGMVYQGLAKEGMPAGDLEQFRATIEGGGEVGFGVRFDIDGEGYVRNLGVSRWTGIAWIDQQWSARDAEAQVSRQPVGREVANFRDVTLDVGVAKDRLRFTGSATAPTEAKAIEAERQLRAQGGGAGFGLNSPGITVSRTGLILTASLDVSLSTLLGR